MVHVSELASLSINNCTIDRYDGENRRYGYEDSWDGRQIPLNRIYFWKQLHVTICRSVGKVGINNLLHTASRYHVGLCSPLKSYREQTATLFWGIHLVNIFI